MPDPVYPVYVDTNIMDGRKILYMDANEANGFLPMPDASVKADLIYLCSPNNPTGATFNREQLKAWVDYALANDAMILFDAAYAAPTKSILEGNKNNPSISVFKIAFSGSNPSTIHS